MNIVASMRARAKKYGYEQVGDIVAEYNHPQQRFEAEAIWCHNEEATETESLPSCGQKRKCRNPHPRRYDWILVGEFHTHPASDEDTVVAMKPPSQHDVYQLILSAYNEQHACTVVIASEGVYFYEPLWMALRRFTHDVHRYYKDQKFDDNGRLRSLRACRQPVAERLHRERHPWLFNLLHNVEPQYYSILREHRTSKPKQIELYNELVTGIGVRTHLLPA